MKLERDRAKAALERIAVAELQATAIAPDLIERFGTLMHENITSGETPFRKAWLESIFDRVEVDDDVIRIVDDKTTLDAAVAVGGAQASPSVRSSVQKWRARKDSNL